MNSKDLLQDAAAGAAAGFAATVPMTATMIAGHYALPDRERYPLEPRLLVEASPVPTDAPKGQSPSLRGISIPAHFGFGAAAGALYPAFRAALPRETPPAAAGVAYGLLVWGVSYAGWIPAVGLLPPPNRHPARRVALIVAAHAVFGAALGLATDRLSRRR